MAKRSESRLSFAAIRVEGSLLLPDVLAKVAAGEAPEQHATNYDIPPGLKLREEVLRYWAIGRALWTRFEAGRAGSNASAVRTAFARDLVTKVLEFDLDDDAKGRGGFHSLTAKSGSVPIVISGDGNVDEIRSIPTSSGKPVRKTPSAWLQTLLNSNDGALWGIVVDGMRLRLLRDNDSLTRPALIEIDLDKIFREQLHDEFTVFWLMCHHTRFGKGDGNPDDCTLERWRGLGNTEGVTARDRLRDGVEVALHHLGTGFLEHPANRALRELLLANARAEGQTARRLAVQDLYKQLLRMVYRMIFLMTAEDRNVLLDPAADPDAAALFRKGYSTDLLRERARQRGAWDRHADAYQGMRVLVRAASAGELRLGIPALGGIFAADQCADIENLPILNQRFLQALYHLSWMDHAKSLVRINWRDMETEELGSVYESLLELTPAITENATRFYFVNGEGDPSTERQGISVKGNARKTTGSYYTPDSLVQLLLDKTLDPVIDDVVANNPGNPEALLALDIIDPACGSGHFLLGAARRVANKLAELRTEGSATEVDYRQAMRDVIGHCIYGVDRNEFAIELCRLALWLESIEPGRPLSFLDSRLVCGDSLVGVFKPEMLRHGIPDEAYAQLTGDDKATATAFRKWNKELRNGGGMFREYAIPEEIVAAADELIAMPSDNLQDVAAQAAAYRELMGKEEWQLFKRACDAYVSAYFVPKRPIAADTLATGHSAQAAANIINRSGIPTSETVYSTLRDGSTQPPFDNAAEDIQALHWFLAFPSVMQKGGFDAVLGNPPWEVVQLSETEYFAGSAPEIASLKGAARKRAIATLEKEQPSLFQAFQFDKRSFDATNEFARSSGRFHLSAKGKINTYALFAELFKDLGNPRGRSGMVVPTGIATDATNSAFFAHLVEHRRLSSLIDFENREGIFPAVDSRTKFSILSLGHEQERAEFSFYLTDPSQVTDGRRRFTLSPQQIADINPNTKTAPVFRSQADAELVARICSRGVPMIDGNSKPETSPFKVVVIQNFFTSSNASDADLFERYHGAVDDVSLFPVRRGGAIWQYDYRFDAPDNIRAQGADWAGRDRFVPRSEVFARLKQKGWARGWLMGWRDIARATDERTVIATALPICATDDTLSLLLPMVDASACCCLLANLNSLVLDYVAQSKVGGTHIRKNVMAQFPVIPPGRYSAADVDFIRSRVLELSYSSKAMTPFADDLGYSGVPFTWDEERRAILRAELDAMYARKYDLSRDDLRYVLDPASTMGEDYPSETFRVLEKNETAQFQEYRTARLVLDAWDRMERGEVALSGLPSASRLELA